MLTHYLGKTEKPICIRMFKFPQAVCSKAQTEAVQVRSRALDFPLWLELQVWNHGRDFRAPGHRPAAFKELSPVFLSVFLTMSMIVLSHKLTF